MPWIWACARGAAGLCFLKSRLGLTPSQPKHNLPRALTPGLLRKDQEPRGLRQPSTEPIPSTLTACWVLGLIDWGERHPTASSGGPLGCVPSSPCSDSGHKLCSQQDSRLALDAASISWLQLGLPDQKLCPWHGLDQSFKQAGFQLSISLGRGEKAHNAKGAYIQAIYLRNFVPIKPHDSYDPAVETLSQLTPETAWHINHCSEKLSSALCSQGSPRSRVGRSGKLVEGPVYWSKLSSFPLWQSPPHQRQHCFN